jgi:predicted TPR repeat methyltransferase
MKLPFRPLLARADVYPLTEEMIIKYMTQDIIVYDIGCGQKPFGKFLKDKVKSHIGVDLADGFYKPNSFKNGIISY